MHISIDQISRSSINSYEIIQRFLPLLIYVNATKPVQHLHYAAKMIVRPEFIQEISVHHAIQVYGNFSNIRVDPFTGVFMHHLKNRTEFRQYWRDNIPKYFYSMSPVEDGISHLFLENLKLGLSVALNELHPDIQPAN